MLASVLAAPHFDLEVEVDMIQASGWRARSSEEAGADVSITALLVKVVAEALRNHPHVNAAFVDGEARVYREINIAVAMAIEEGLLAPVIRRADAMSLGQIQESLTHLRDKAKRRKLARSELSGGTFTVSNLGMYGIDAFRAIINPPQAAILAVGRIAERPVGVDGQITLRPMMRLVLSIDHRLLDGAQAAPFLVEVRRKLESPPMLP
jgi:pyruvate dehydrogenase E2 component (dihydrolipoamide acetyltransferase)